MIIIKTKGKFFSKAVVWFWNEESSLDLKTSSIEVRAVKNQIFKNSNIVFQESLITNFNEFNREEYFNKLKKNTKYEINRAQRDGVTCAYLNSTDLEKFPEILDEFAQCYIDMAKSKNYKSSVNKKELLAYIEKNALLFSIASNYNKSFVYHVYIVDGKNSRLLFSCSNYRNKDSKEQEMIGRANRLLSYKDVLFFNDSNYTNLDWGGVSSFENPNNIDKFKMEFLGEPIKYINEFKTNSKLLLIKNYLKKLNG